MKTPKFWHKKNPLAYLFLPLSILYLFGHFLNFFRKIPTKVNKPVICIGNLVAGGAGKTPVAIAIGEILKEMNIDFAYLSGGHGGEIRDFILVNEKEYNSKDVGDEPLLLSEIASTFISRNRLSGAKKIAAMPAKKLIIMDDGLQNPTIIKDFSILVIDGNYGIGNGFMMPAGPLREPVQIGIKKADLVIIIGDDKVKIAKSFCIGKKVIKAKIKAVNSDKFHKKSVIAFCGIGRPEKFFDSLKQNEINIITKFSYADHHQYKEREIKKMISLAKKSKVKLITTKKDWIRLEPMYQRQIDYLDIKIEFENVSYLKEKLIKLVNG